jgi:hypothetical protein
MINNYKKVQFSVVTATILLLLFTHFNARSQSFDFDGVNGKAALSGVLTNQPDNFTLECWVYPRAYNGNSWTVLESNKQIGLGFSHICAIISIGFA